MTAQSRVADPVLLDFLFTAQAPPRDASIRLDVVKLALAKLATTRRYDRLAAIFRQGDEFAVKPLVLAASHALEGALCILEDDETGDYNRAIKALAPAIEAYDETFLRIVEVAGDILDWDGGEAEYEHYVRPAWLVLADELEFEQEERDAIANADYGYSYGPPDASELRAMAQADRRASRNE